MLLVVLGAVFLAGFSEAVSIAIPLVAIYLLLNAVVVAAGLVQILTDPGQLPPGATRSPPPTPDPARCCARPCWPSPCWCWGCRGSRPA